MKPAKIVVESVQVVILVGLLLLSLGCLATGNLEGCMLNNLLGILVSVVILRKDLLKALRA